MGSILSKLWNDPDYFRKTLTFMIATVAGIIPTLPLGELGAFGYWFGKFAIPLSIALGATAKGSGLTPGEAAKLRALLPTDEQLDRIAPQITVGPRG